MNIKNLTIYYNQLKNFDIADAWMQYNNYIEYIKSNIDSDNQSSIDEISLLQSNIDSDSVKLQKIINGIKLNTLNDILQAEKPLLKQSHETYCTNVETYEFISEWDLYIKPDNYDLIKKRIGNYISWQHSGLLFRPRRPDIINSMVAADPLFLVDTNSVLLSRCTLSFPPQYQNRCRTYLINESEENILEFLPTHQFGICVAFEFFDFRPIEVIHHYLIEIFDKLKPGGMLCFSFNDCDKECGIKLAESGFCKYTPRRMVQKYIDDIGYITKFILSDDGHALTWVELQKPGELTSIRGGQTIAKIV